MEIVELFKFFGQKQNYTVHYRYRSTINPKQIELIDDLKLLIETACNFVLAPRTISPALRAGGPAMLEEQGNI